MYPSDEKYLICLSARPLARKHKTWLFGKEKWLPIADNRDTTFYKRSGNWREKFRPGKHLFSRDWYIGNLMREWRKRIEKKRQRYLDHEDFVYRERDGNPRYLFDYNHKKKAYAPKINPRYGYRTGTNVTTAYLDIYWKDFAIEALNFTLQSPDPKEFDGWSFNGYKYVFPQPARFYFETGEFENFRWGKDED